jgi:hypothetical protein
MNSSDLDGLPLGKAFMRCVIEDAKIQDLGASVVLQELHHRFVFDEGRLPGRDENYRWPVAPPEGWLREQFGSGRIADGFDYFPSNAVRNVSAFMNHRIRALFDPLRSGEMIAIGIYCATGVEATVNKAQWSRSEATLDVRTSDLFETIDGRLTRLWTNLRIAVASQPIVIRGKTKWAPFTPDEVATVGSLERALDQLVFNHPRVTALRQKAKEMVAAEKKPFYDNAGLLSAVFGHDEEMVALKSFAGRDQLMSREERELEAATPWADSVPRWPKEYDDFSDEIELRACALIEMLKSGRLEGICYTAHTKERETLLPTVWTREEYYILPHAGDIFEAQSMKMVARWTGIVLQVPASATRLIPAIIDTSPKIGAENVATLSAVPSPNQKSIAVPGRKRGQKPTTLARVAAAMRTDLANATLTVDALDQMLEKSLEEKYAASRDTCRKARGIVLAERAGFESAE